MHILSLLSALTLPALALAVVGPGKVTGDTAVHDPTMCKDAAGTYFVFSTGTGLEIRTSPDRTAWTRAGSVWPAGAPWTDAYTGTANGVLWAPDCTIVNGTFYLYYAASSFGSQNSAIFLATSRTGAAGSWTNEGLVTSTSSADNYNAIDPNLIIDAGKWHLSLGSFWSGIKMISLDAATGKPASPSPALTALAERTADSGAIEASVVWKQGAQFFLFSSWDLCCQGVNSTYNIRVGRGTSVAGPYADRAGVALTAGGGTLVLGTHDNIVGPGGQDLFADTDGTILVYHYYTPTGSFLGINRLDFASGWPAVV